MEGETDTSWLGEIKQWFIKNLREFQDWVIDILKSAAGWVVDQFLSAILWVIEQLPIPDFVKNTTLGDYIPPDIGWMLSQSGIDDALTLISSAIVFRTLRRILTLGIW